MQYEYAHAMCAQESLCCILTVKKEDKENLPFHKSLILHWHVGSDAQKASTELPIYNWLLTKSHCAG